MTLRERLVRERKENRQRGIKIKPCQQWQGFFVPANQNRTKRICVRRKRKPNQLY